MSETLNEKYTVPIYSNGIGDKALYGYTNIARVKKDAVTISARGTIGFPEIRRAPFFPIVRLIVAIPKTQIISLEYLKISLSNILIRGNGNSIPQLTVPMIEKYKIPLPEPEIQKLLVEQFYRKEEAIKANKELIEVMQENINEKISEIWSEDGQ